MATPRRSRLAGAVRHPIRAGRVVSSWYRNDPDRLVVVASQLLPAGLARRAAPVLDFAPLRRLAPATAALVGLRAGRTGPVAAGCAQLAETERVNARVRTAVVLAAAERLREAAALVAGLDGTPKVEIAKAKLDYRAGRIGAAVERLRVLGPAGGRGAARLLARYQGELAALAPVTRADAAPPEPVAPAPGRILHLVTNALPYISAGYTVRTHRIATAQRALGLEPHVVTSWGWPALQGFVAAPAEERVDGIAYHRLLPDGPIPATADARLDRAVRTRQPWPDGCARRCCTLPAITATAPWRSRSGTEPGCRSSTRCAASSRRPGGQARTGRQVGRRQPALRAGQGSGDQCDARRRRAVQTLSATMRSDIVARGVPADRIVLAPNAVDGALLTARPDGTGFRRAHGIPDGAVVVGSVSTLKQLRGFRHAPRRGRAAARGGRSGACPAGRRGPDRAALRAQAAALGLAGQVTLSGRVPHDQALAAHAALDIFVIPRTDAG